MEFGAKAAFVYAELCNLRLKQGFHIDAFELMIAAIAHENEFAIVTLNTSDLLFNESILFSGKGLLAPPNQNELSRGSA